VNESARETKPDLAITDVVWMMAKRLAESNKTTDEQFPDQADLKMLEWFEESGGVMSKLEYAQDVLEGDEGKVALRRRRLVVKEGESLSAGEPIFKVPIKLTLSQMSARFVKIEGHGHLGDRRHLKDAFQHSHKWALAHMLLHQYYKGGRGDGVDSIWAPYLLTLRLHSLSKPVLKEMQATYAAELQRSWDEEASACHEWISENICKKHERSLCSRDTSRPGARPLNTDDFKWALGIVRTFAFNVTKRAGGRNFLALIPFADMLKHKRGGGGKCYLELDNSIEISLGEDLDEGEAAEYDRGATSDAESLLK
jgi:hypothetical protein